MVMPNMPSADLATGDIKWRAAKILFEKIARKIGVDLGKTDVSKRAAAWVKQKLEGTVPAHWLEDAMGIFGAAFIQAPGALAVAVAKFFGQDENKVSELLNEALDSAILGYVGQLGATPVWDADDATVKMAGYLDDVDEDRWRQFNQNGLQKKVAKWGGCLHDVKDCPEIHTGRSKRSRRKPGFTRDGEPEEVVEMEGFREGVQIYTLEKALQLGLDPTYEPSCCGGVKKLYDEVLKKPTDLFTIIEGFKSGRSEKAKDARELYYKGLTSLSPAERALLQDLGTRTVWTPGIIEAWLCQSLTGTDDNKRVDFGSFMKLLQTKEKPMGESLIGGVQSFLARNMKALVGGEPSAEVDKIRGNVDRFTSSIQRDAVRRRRRANELDAEFRRK